MEGKIIDLRNDYYLIRLLKNHGFSINGILDSASHFQSLQTLPTSYNHDEQLVENLMRPADIQKS